MAAVETAKPKFPKTFWTANTIELFERAAYYAMASFMVIYLHENLGMSPSLATTLNSSVLWAIVYFMPIVSGTLADKFGFKRSLGILLRRDRPGLPRHGEPAAASGPVSPGPARTGGSISSGPVLLGIVLIGLGGSIVKPCIAGTVQKTAGTRATLAFGIFYMVINIGSITGRSIAYVIRTNLGIPAIFTYVSAVFALVGLAVVSLHLPRAGVRERRGQGRPEGPEEDARAGRPRHLHRPPQPQVPLPDDRPGPVLVPLSPGLQPHPALHAARRSQRAHGALHPGQSDHDRLLPDADHEGVQEVDPHSRRSSSAPWS